VTRVTDTLVQLSYTSSITLSQKKYTLNCPSPKSHVFKILPLSSSFQRFCTILARIHPIFKGHRREGYPILAALSNCPSHTNQHPASSRPAPLRIARLRPQDALPLTTPVFSRFYPQPIHSRDFAPSWPASSLFSKITGGGGTPSSAARSDCPFSQNANTQPHPGLRLSASTAMPRNDALPLTTPVFSRFYPQPIHFRDFAPSWPASPVFSKTTGGRGRGFVLPQMFVTPTALIFSMTRWPDHPMARSSRDDPMARSPDGPIFTR